MDNSCETPSRQRPGALSQPCTPAKTVTETDTFHGLHQQIRQEGPAKLPLPPALSGKTVLWTPGFMARHKGNHSKQVLARIRRLGLNVVPVPVNSDVATGANIELITRQIKALKPGEGILAGHSRGGVMNLDAYRQLGDEDKERISRIILIQSPLNGTPLADFVLANKFRRRLLAVASRVVLGNNVVDTIHELSIKGREAAHRGLPPLPANDLNKIYTLRSTIAAGERPSYELERSIIERYGELSDGITPYAMSELQGVRDITLKSYDHENLVIQEPTLIKRLSRYRTSKDYEAGDVTEALLHLLYLDSSTSLHEK
jgi:pimeloyl-ACP methyl ester carboxylesterase